MRQVGVLYPRSQRELPIPTYAFRLELPPHVVRTVYVRAAGEAELQVPLDLWDLGALARTQLRFQVVTGLVLGIMLALALYNAFLFAFVRETAHLYYAGQVVSGVIWLSVISGTLLDVMPSSVERMPLWTNMVAVGAYYSLALQFTRRFLQLRAVHPRLDTTLLLAIGVEWVFVGLFVAGVVRYDTASRWAQVAVFVLAAGIVAAAALRWRAGFVAARYIVLAWGVLCACFVPLAAAQRGFLPWSTWPFIYLAFTAEAILMSLALADAAKRRNDHVARLHAAGGRFVPYEFLSLLGRRELPDVKRGDQVEKVMTVFFLDVRSFTTLVERMTPQDTMAFVNTLFCELEAPIVKHHGVIDKFIGDAVMALFESADDAVQAAAGCLEAVRDINERRSARGESPVGIGIGLHTGELMLGTVGGERRLSCTVIGDAVNLASRIEGMTRTFGASVLMTEATRRVLSNHGRFTTRALGRVVAKGKSEPIAIHELLDTLPEAERRDKVETMSDFEEGCRQYQAGALDDARATFERCRRAGTPDAAATLYLKLCSVRRGEDADGWDGAVRLDAK